MRAANLIALICGSALSAAAYGQVDTPPSLAHVVTTLMQDSVLSLVTDNQQQQIEIEVGPAPGEVRVFGISGIPDGFPFTGVSAIELITGTAQDYVEFRIFAADVPPISVNTRAGNSDVKFIYFTPGGNQPVSSDVVITGGANNDKAAFEVYNEAASFTANWTVSHGNGDNEAKASIDSQPSTSLIDVNFATAAGLGQDKAELAIISAAEQLEVSFTPRTGSGNDSAILIIDSIDPVDAGVFFDTNLGAGQDVAEAIAVLRGGTIAFTGRMLGGAGDDNLKLLIEGDGSSSFVMNGGAGHDYLDMEYKGRVTGSPRLLGADGNDFLKIVATNPSAMTPTLDGGAGYDEAIGFGRFIRVEKIN